MTAADEPAPFRVAVAPGVTPGKWVGRWVDRRPDDPIVVVPTPEAAGIAVLHEDAADVSFVRLPVDRDGVSVIPLYEEVPVVVVPTDHLLTAADEVTVADLDGLVLLGAAARVLGWADALAGLAGPAVPDEGPLEDTLALVAAGIGVAVVPQSVARAHARRDLTTRPVTDLPPTRVGLAWLEDRTTPDVEDFIGIVRGRTANSSRAPLTGRPAPDAVAPAAATPERRRGGDGGRPARPGPPGRGRSQPRGRRGRRG